MNEIYLLRSLVPLVLTFPLLFAAETVSVESYGTSLERYGILGIVCVVQWLVIRYIMQRYEKAQHDRYLDMQRQIEQKDETLTQLTQKVVLNTDVNKRVEKLLQHLDEGKKRGR